MRISKIQKILIIVAGILVIISLNFFQTQVREVFYFISSPIQKIFWQEGQKISDFGEVFLEMKDLEKKNQEFKTRIKQLQSEVAFLKEKEKENETLRKALDIGLEEEFNLQFAQIIEKDPSEDFILINKGYNQGIEEDFPVVTEGKVLFGKTFQIYNNFSKVMLISNKESVFDAKIQDKEISGIIKGKGNLKLIFDLIPFEVEIKKGDVVVSSTLGKIFPRGLLVGKIEKIIKEDIKPFQKAEITPFFELKETESLFIIKP